MFLIVGLGNPDAKYERTWHNLGFLVVEAVRSAHADQFDPWRRKSRLHSDLCEGSIGGQRVVLAKPQTYMNRSGEAIAALLHSYRLTPDELWVVHDEVDLPLGRHKLSADASAAGHRGVASVIEALGTQAFARFRLGIATERLGKIPTEDYVLTSPTTQEESVVSAMVNDTSTAIANAITGNLHAVMASYNATAN